jgi:hypothetical protein
LGEGDVAEPKRQSVEVGGEAKQVDPAAVGLGCHDLAGDE